MAFEYMMHPCFDAPKGRRSIKVVTEHDIEYDRECDICREPLAPTREVLAHIYSYLLEQSTHD